MTWANPLLLAGLAAAALPLVLHLLGRARARRIDWAATMFLPRPAAGGADAAGRGRHRLLLLVRCLAVAALAVALARPTSGDANPAEPGVAVVLVLDASPSMTHPDGDTTRFELARRAAFDRLSRLRQGDQAGLVVLGVVPPADVPLTPDLQAVASQLASLSTGVAAADMGEGDRRARGMLADAGVDNGEVLLIGDRQRSAWTPLRAATADGGPAARSAAVPVGSTENDNAWIESVELLNPPAVVGTTARFAVTLRGGDVPQGRLTLDLSLGRGVEARGPAAVAAHGRTRVVRTLVPTRLGPAVVIASIDPTGLPGDDVARLAIDVVPPPRVRTVGPATRPADVAPADVVVVRGLPDPAAVSALETFVAGGGGLLLAPGPGMTPDAWNARLWKNGFGLAPAASAVITPRTPVRPSDVPAFVDPDDAAVVAAGPYWRLSPAGSETAIGRLNDAPWLVERPFGRGRVLTIALAPADADAPLTAALVRRLMPRPPNRNVDVGVPLETPAGPRDRYGFVLRPDGRFDRVGLNAVAGPSPFRYARTDLPGRYAVRVGDRPAVDWIVRADPAESELDLLDDAALADVLRGTNVAARAERPAKRTAADYTAIIVIAVVGLLTAEITLAGAFLPARGRA